MILREQIHPVIQRALYRKIDAINRIKVGEVNGNNYFDLGALNVLGPTTEPGTNPVEQILTRSCWAKVSAAVFGTKKILITNPMFKSFEKEIETETMVSLSSFRDKDGNLINQPLSFRNGFDEKNYSDSMLRGHAGITSITSEYKNFFIKESVVSFVCPDPDTFQDINDVFLKHGQYVSIEFGWGIESPAQMPRLNSDELKKLSQNIRARNLRGAGNYQCLVGVVSNFSFNQRTDGGYEGSFTVISAAQNILYTGIPTGNLQDNVTFAQRKKISQGKDATKQQEEDWKKLRRSFATFNAVIENLDSVVDEHLSEIIEPELDYTTERTSQGMRNFYNALNAKRKLKDEEARKKGIQRVFSSAAKSNQGSVLYYYKDGAMRLLANTGVKGGKLDDVKRFVSWGWFEDYILNSFFSYELKGDIKLGEVRSTTNGVLNKCQTSNQLSSMGLDSIILPGKTITPRKKIELSALPELDTIEAVAEATEDTDLSNPNIFSQYGVVFQKTKKRMDKKTAININKLNTILSAFDKTFKRFEEQKITRTEQNVTDPETNEVTDDTIITTTGVNTGRHGFIRNMVFNIDYIAESFAGVSSLEIGLRKFWSKVSGEYGGFWNFAIANDEDNSGKIGIIDTYYNPQPDLPTMLENRSKREDFVNYKRKKDTELLNDKTDKIFTFPVYSKDSIVKDFSLSVNLSPEAVTLAVYGSNSDVKTGTDSNKGISEPAVRAYSLLLNKNFTTDRKEGRGIGSSTVLSGIETPLQQNDKGYASTIERFGGLEPLRKGEGINFSQINDLKDDTNKILTGLLEKESTETLNQTNIIYDVDTLDQNFKNYFVYNPSTGVLKDSFKQFMISIINKSENPAVDSNYTRLKPIIPLDLDLTIDGVGGLKPGDLFRVDYLPQPYREFCYFIIFNVSQEITNGGWFTKIKAKAIADLKTLGSPAGEAYQINDKPKEEPENTNTVTLDSFIDMSILDEAEKFKQRQRAGEAIQEATPSFIKPLGEFLGFTSATSKDYGKNNKEVVVNAKEPETYLSRGTEEQTGGEQTDYS